MKKENRIVEFHGIHEICFHGHGIRRFNGINVIKCVCEKTGKTFEEVTDELIKLIMDTLDNKDIVHY